MKVLVDEIDLNTLNNVKKFFVTDDEIKFIDFCDKSLAYYDCEKPYYIEENIIDLDFVLKLCKDVDMYESEIRDKVDWNSFSLFWWLILEIKKQRDVGFKISDIQYVFAKTKDRVSVKLTDTDKLNQGFTFNPPHLCIVGESELGEMTLYKEFEETPEFVFDFTYLKKNIFKKFKTVYNHFHPQNFEDAIVDVISWMTNDKTHFGWFK